MQSSHQACLDCTWGFEEDNDKEIPKNATHVNCGFLLQQMFYNIPATAEVGRMLLHLAGVELQENRLEFNSKEWNELKPSE